jgi:hypothetical protein
MLPPRALWCVVVTVASFAVLRAQQPPPPRPFPQPSQPRPTTAGNTTPVKPAAPAPTSGQSPGAVPDEALLGVPIYPSAQFLTSYDAGRGQRFYLFGSTLPFAEMVNYYRTTLKTRGDVLFETPPTHQFEIGRFREETMAFPPSVTIKDYTWGGSGGFPNPKRGVQPARFPTVIQIVPTPAGSAQ